MERRRSIEHKKATDEHDPVSKVEMYEGENVAQFEHELAALRQASMGGNLEDHKKWLADCIKLNYFSFLYTQDNQIVSALLGRRVPLDYLPANIRAYTREYSNEAPERPIVWCSSLTTHPDYQAKGFASECVRRFSEYTEFYYRMSGAFLSCRIRQQNFASEFSFAKGGFKPTGLLDQEDISNNNFTNFQFWIKVIPPLYSEEAKTFLTEDKRRQLQASTAPFYIG